MSVMAYPEASHHYTAQQVQQKLECAVRHPEIQVVCMQLLFWFMLHAHSDLQELARPSSQA